MQKGKRLDEFTLAYIECMLWAECANVDPDEGSDESFSDAGFSLADFAPETLEHVIRDCERFQSAFSELITDDTQSGHDFWLDRGGHGAGAEDRECEHDHLPSQCPRNVMLHAGAVWFGHLDVYLGDDGLIYLSPDPWSAAMHARRLDRDDCALVDRYLASGELPQ